MTWVGLTWDHPRGRDALDEAARRANADRPRPLLRWDWQPLEGFESAPIADLAARHDLVVMDHPHVGEAAAEGCLIALEELYEPERIAVWADACVGASFASYRWDGRHWALPLDVAAQVSARRPDRIAAPPTSWDEIEEIARRQPVALSLGGPHAYLCLISMAAGQGSIVGGEMMLPDDAALAALARLRRLAERAPAGTGALNPIALLETAAGSGDVALIPLVFGYVTYARPGPGRNVLAYSDPPRAPEGRGGTLGGTGVAFSRRSAPDRELREHVASLLSPETQRDLFPAFGGQPSSRAVWRSDKANAAWGNFYRDTLETAERALLRPRFDGFPAFCTTASSRMREALERGEDEERTLAELRALWRKARARARGDLDDRRHE